MFEHGDVIADTNSECSATASFTDHDADDRSFQSRHGVHVFGNDPGLATFLGANSRIGKLYLQTSFRDRQTLAGEVCLHFGVKFQRTRLHF